MPFRYFVYSSFRLALFRLFVIPLGVFLFVNSSFRLASFRLGAAP